MRAFFLVIFLIAIAFVGWYCGTTERSIEPRTDSGADAAVSSPSETRSNLLSSTIHCQGKLVPASGLIRIVAPVGSRISKLTDKAVGEEVAEGEVLATLQGQDVRKRELKLAQARRSDAIKGADFEKDQGQFKLSVRPT